MGTRIRAFDWAATPLGPPASWPQPLRSAISLCLGSAFPTAIYWGPDLHLIYNDAWAPIPDEKHPWALGRPGAEVWPDIWNVVGPQFLQVMRTGEGFSAFNQMLPMVRAGRTVETYWNYSFTPIRDDSGTVLGILNQGNETTAQVVGQRYREAELGRLREMFQQAPGAIAFLAGSNHVIEFANQAYIDLIGDRTLIGRPVAEAIPEVVKQGFIDLLDKVYRTGEPYIGKSTPVQLLQGPHPQTRILDFIYQPVRDATGKISGIFVNATDVTDRERVSIALRDSEERFRLIAESAPVMLWMGDANGKCIYLNRQQREFWGLDWATVPSFDWNSTLHPDDRDKLFAPFARAMQAKTPFTSEARFRRAADGSYRLLRTQAQPRFGAGNEFLGMVGVNVDITDAERGARQRDALLELADRHRELTEPADIAFASAEILGRTLQISRAGYGTIDRRNETITIERDWNAPGIKSLAGVLNFRDYGSYIEDLKRGETVIFADAEKDPRTAATAGALKAISAQSVVNMPVTEQGDFVALLYLNHATAREWPPEEITFVREVAERTRIAVERRRAELALQEETARLQVLNSVGATVAAELDSERIVQTVTDAGVELSGAEFGAFFYNVLDAKGESYMLYALSGVPREAFSKFPMPRNTAVFAPTFSGEGIVRSDDILKDRRYGKSDPHFGMPKGHLPVRSYLAVPVMSRSGEVIGGMFFGHAQPGVFKEEHERLLLGIAGQAATSIDNARLFQAAERELAEKRRAEAALRESEARFRGITNSIDQMIWSTQPDGYHDYYNDRWYEYTGVPHGTTDGEAWNGMFHPDDQERAWKIWRHSLETGEPYHIEYRLRHRTGQYRWVLGRAQAVRDADGTITRWFGTCTDIQDIVDAREVLARSRVELEREVEERTGELMAAEAKLRQAQKMEAVGQLTGGIAHDFNNMLAVVIGGLNLLQRRLDRGDTNVSKYIDAAMEGANRAASLTQRLLAFSRQQPLAPEPLDANRMVAGMSELLSRSIGERVRIETVLGAGLWKTFADPVQLESAILNLSVNARDAMPEGGKLTIETANSHVDENFASEYQIAAGQYVLIAVTDTGTGMSQQVMAQAFDPFFTTKEVGQGTGLGLSQVFGFVRQSGGHVKLYSEIGVGTTVKIYLPRYYGEVKPQESGPGDSRDHRGHPSEIVMVVEDDERVRSYSTEALRELGYTVVAASGGPEALRMIEAGQEVTLLFTDVVMPEMTGRQLADEAVRRIDGLKVLFTTGYTRNAVVHNGVLDAGTNFLLKPFGIDQLAAKVRSVLDGV